MIVICHIFQEYGNFLAFHFNVGVFTFLFISGFIFGGRNIENPVQFIKQRLKRLLIPYYLFIFAISAIYLIFFRDQWTFLSVIKNILCVQWFFNGLPQVAHLWYITCIIICYLFTPLLQKLFDKLNKASLYGFMLLLFVLLFIANYFSGYNFISIYAYIIGYFSSRVLMNFKNDIRAYKEPIILILFLGITVETIRLFADIKAFPIPGVLVETSKLIISLAIIGFCILIQKIYKRFSKIFYISDKYSYEIYLTHHIWILGILSVMDITKFAIFNVLLAIILTGISAFTLNYISNKIMRVGVSR